MERRSAAPRHRLAPIVAGAAIASGIVVLSLVARPLLARTQAHDTVLERLQRLEDREQILDLFTAYGATLDRGDFAAFEALFAEDAEYGGGAGPLVHGRAAIRASLESIIARNPANLPKPDFHLYFNPTIEVTGDRATARSLGAYVVPDAGTKGARLAIFVTYEDVLVRRDGRWLFLRRAIHGGIPATIR